MKSSHICGIYMITCSSDRGFDFIYIGQSYKILQRLREHTKDLSYNIHPNPILQKVYNKYGQDDFNFYILEECDISKLDEREIYYINYYDSHKGDHGLNCTVGGKGHRGFKHSEERKMKISENSKKLWRENPKIFNRHNTRIEIELFNIITKEIVMVKGIGEFCQKCSLCSKTMKKLRNESILEYRGYRLSKNKDVIYDSSKHILVKEGKRKLWTIISPCGGILRINDMVNFCKEKNLRYTGFAEIRYGSRKSYKKYKYFREPTIENPWDSKDFAEMAN